MSNGEIIDVDSGGNVVPERRPARHPNHGKRGPGNPLKSKAFQNFVQELLERNTENIERWLNEVAEGKPTRIIDPDPENGIMGGVIPGIDPDPAKAVDLIVKLAEFGAPKQGRVVVANDPENPFSQPVLNVTIGGKKIEVSEGGTTPIPDRDGD